MKTKLSVVLALFSSALVAGCWVAHTAHDRPELRANVGKKGVLTEPCGLFRDRGGRLHLEKDDVPGGFTLVEKLPAGSVLEIKDVIYRISDPGRHDYYLVEVHSPSGVFTVEVPAEERHRPTWRYDEKG